MASRPLDIFIYGVGAYQGEIPDTQEKIMVWLSNLGFKVNPNNKLMKSNLMKVGLVNQEADNVDHVIKRYPIFYKISTDPDSLYLSDVTCSSVYISMIPLPS